MQYIKQTLDDKTRTKLRLSEVERLLKERRIIVPTPSRQKLRRLCEDGTLETAGSAPGEFGWLVYEDSFWEWVRRIDGQETGKS